MTKDEIVTRLAVLDAKIVEATKADLQGGNGVTMKQNVAFVESLHSQQKMLLDRLGKMGYELNAEGEAVENSWVRTSVGVLRHGRI